MLCLMQLWEHLLLHHEWWRCCSLPGNYFGRHGMALWIHTRQVLTGEALWWESALPLVGASLTVLVCLEVRWWMFHVDRLGTHQKGQAAVKIIVKTKFLVMLHKASKCQLDLCCVVARAYHTMLYFFENAWSGKHASPQIFSFPYWTDSFY